MCVCPVPACKRFRFNVLQMSHNKFIVSQKAKCFTQCQVLTKCKLSVFIVQNNSIQGFTHLFCILGLVDLQTQLLWKCLQLLFCMLVFLRADSECTSVGLTTCSPKQSAIIPLKYLSSPLVMQMELQCVYTWDWELTRASQRALYFHSWLWLNDQGSPLLSWALDRDVWTMVFRRLSPETQRARFWLRNRDSPAHVDSRNRKRRWVWSLHTFY